MEFVIGLIVGLLLGGAAVWIFLSGRSRRLSAEISTAREELAAQLRETFDSLAARALDANSQRLTERTETALNAKKELIDQSVKAINDRLNSMGEYFRTLEGERKTEFGRLSASVSTLAVTTGELHKVLASTQRRGAWGERMAEDILRLLGMKEGVNYRKQSADDAESGRPDFTFPLPNDLVVNMDVKFPLEHYKGYIDADDDQARDVQRRQLVNDVKGHIREVARRGYVDSQGSTVPYALVFIPSEQLYSLVLDTQPDIIDEALASHIVLASPITLYAMLAVIRQAAENINVMKTADEVITLLGGFNQQWGKYKEAVEKLGKYIEQAAGQFNILTTTRTNMLQKPLDKIEDIRQRRGLPQLEADEDE